MLVEDLFDDGVDLDEGPGGGDGLGLDLAGLVDEEGGARVEEAAGGLFVFISPGGQTAPDGGAPAMVSLDDERGLAPAGGGLEGGEELAEDAVGEGEIVEVGAATLAGEAILGAAPGVGAVRDGEVEEDEVGLIGVEKLEGVLLEVVLGLAAQAEVKGAEIAVGAGGGDEFDGELMERGTDVGGEGGTLRHGAVLHVVVGPVAVLDVGGVDGAVGVVPADGGGAPSGLHGVAEDGAGAVDELAA